MYFDQASIDTLLGRDKVDQQTVHASEDYMHARVCLSYSIFSDRYNVQVVIRLPLENDCIL